MIFFVPCLPVAQPRPRATAMGGFTRMYEAKKSHAIHEFKASVKLAWKNAGAEKLEGPISAVIECVFARPVKVPKKLGTGRLLKATKSDCDNLAKGVLDSLNKLAYNDDGQVAVLLVKKYHAAEGETPGVTVQLIPMEPKKLKGTT